MDLGEKVQYALDKIKATQADFERIAGTDRRKISNIINGKTTNPTINTLVAIAKTCDVSLDWLIGLSDSPIYVSGEEMKRLCDGFKTLERPDREKVLEYVDMLVEKKKAEMPDRSIPDIA